MTALFSRMAALFSRMTALFIEAGAVTRDQVHAVRLYTRPANVLTS